MSKHREREDLVLQLGMYLRPALDLANREPPPADQDYRVAGIKAEPDYARFMERVRSFVAFGAEQDVAAERAVSRAVRDVPTWLINVSENKDLSPAEKQQDLQRNLARAQRDALEAINRVPIAFDAVTFPKGTPLRAFLEIRALVASARERVHYFDPYLREDFVVYHLPQVDRDVEVVLVTTPGEDDRRRGPYGVRCAQPLAEKASAEFRAFSLYQVSQWDAHDRLLRVDDQVYALGNSLERVGFKPTTLTRAASQPPDLAALEDIIERGELVVGGRYTRTQPPSAAS